MYKTGVKKKTRQEGDKKRKTGLKERIKSYEFVHKNLPFSFENVLNNGRTIAFIKPCRDMMKRRGNERR